MTMAFALINSEIEAEREVLEELKKIDGVAEVNKLLGPYQIFARLQGDMDKIKEAIYRISKANNVYTARFCVAKD